MLHLSEAGMQSCRHPSTQQDSLVILASQITGWFQLKQYAETINVMFHIELN